MGALSWSWRNILCEYRNTRRDSNAGIATSEFSAVVVSTICLLGGTCITLRSITILLQFTIYYCCISVDFYYFPLVRKIDVLPEKKYEWNEILDRRVHPAQPPWLDDNSPECNFKACSAMCPLHPRGSEPRPAPLLVHSCTPIRKLHAYL